MKIKLFQLRLNTLESSINAWLENNKICHVYGLDYLVKLNGDVIVIVRYEEYKKKSLKEMVL